MPYIYNPFTDTLDYYTTGGSGSGTVNNGTANQVAYYAANGTAVIGNANLTIVSGNPNSTLQIGVPNTSSNLGRIALSYQGSVNDGTIILAAAGGSSGTKTLTVPNITSTLAVTGNDLSVFAATTSAQLAGVISDETGSGALVFATSPTLVTPTLGVATATRLGIGVAADASRLLLVQGDVSGGIATIERTNASTNAGLTTLILKGTSTGVVADGLGPVLNFAIAGSGLAETVIGRITVTRNGADTSGQMVFSTFNSGSPSAFLTVTPAGVTNFTFATIFSTNITTPSVLASSNGSGSIGASGTAFSNLFLASGGVINWNAADATITHSTASLTLGGNVAAIVFGPASLATNGTQNFFSITGTLPTTPVAAITAASFSITTAGNQAFNQVGLSVSMVAGYTGVNSVIAMSFAVSVAGTGANYFTETGNIGVGGITNGSTATGHNVGGWFNARNGLNNVGVFGRAIVATNSALNIGVFGAAVSGTNFVGGYFGLHSAIPTIAASAALMCDNGSQGVDIFVARNNGTAQFKIGNSNLISLYSGVATAGWGVPAIYGNGRSTGQTAAVASVTSYTVGAADGSFIISANLNVTTSTTYSINVQVTYTDETNTAQTLTLNFQSLAGALLTAITNVQGAGPYEGIPVHVRCKASTAITVKTAGTFTSVTYNVEGNIRQIS